MYLGKPRKLVQAAGAGPAAPRVAWEPTVAADPVERVVVVHEPHVPDGVEADADVSLST